MSAVSAVSAAVFAFGALSGCAQRSSAPPPERSSVAMDDLCPLYTSGAKVEFARVEGGGSLTFTGGAASVAELRGRARRVVNMHNDRLDTRARAGEASSDQSADRWRMPQARASVQDVQGGARVVLIPSDAVQLGSLREHMQTQLGRINYDECPALWRPARSSPVRSASPPS